MITLNLVAPPLPKPMNVQIAVGYDSAGVMLRDLQYKVHYSGLAGRILGSATEQVNKVARAHWDAHMAGQAAGIVRTDKEQQEADEGASRQSQDDRLRVGVNAQAIYDREMEGRMRSFVYEPEEDENWEGDEPVDDED
jgi:hypothetical protein